MKKVFALLLASALAFGMAGCGAAEEASPCQTCDDDYCDCIGECAGDDDTSCLAGCASAYMGCYSDNSCAATDDGGATDCAE